MRPSARSPFKWQSCRPKFTLQVSFREQIAARLRTRFTDLRTSMVILRPRPSRSLKTATHTCARPRSNPKTRPALARPRNPEENLPRVRDARRRRRILKTPRRKNGALKTPREEAPPIPIRPPPARVERLHAGIRRRSPTVIVVADVIEKNATRGERTIIRDLRMTTTILDISRATRVAIKTSSPFRKTPKIAQVRSHGVKGPRKLELQRSRDLLIFSTNTQPITAHTGFGGWRKRTTSTVASYGATMKISA